MVKYHISHKRFERKPEKKEIARVVNYILKNEKAIDTDMRKLAHYLSEGKSIIACEFEGILIGYKPRKRLIKGQELILIDVDNAGSEYFSIKDAFNNEFIKRNASFIYKTFSSNVERERFRVVFKLDKVLKNYKQVEAVYESIFKEFPSGVVDEGCKQSSRLFFGGKDYIEVDFNNELEVNEVYLKIAVDDEEVKKEIERVKVEKDKWVNNYKARNRKVLKTDIEEQLSIFDGIPTYPTYKLIQLGNCDDEIKVRWSKYSVRLKDKSAFINYVKSINMFELLGIPETESTFQCVVYKDTNPSASIFVKEGTDVYLYNRKSKVKEYNFTGNIIQVVQRLTGYNFTQALLKMSMWMDIQYGLSEDIEKIVESLDVNITLLQQADLKDSYPSIFRVFKNYRQDITYILDILKKNIMEDSEGNMRFISKISYRSLSEMMYMTPEKYRTVGKIINLLAFTNWLVKLKEEDIPEDIRNNILSYKRSNNYKYHLNIIEVIALQDDFIDNLESLTDLMSESSLTAKNLNWDTVFRISGKEKADEVFPQVKKGGLGKTSNEIGLLLEDIINRHVVKGHYIEERELLSLMSRKYGKTKSEAYFKGAKAEVMGKYGLVNVRLNKALKSHFKVEDKYSSTQSPRILMLKEELDC